MIRGTTPTYVFNLPFDVATIDKARVIFRQKDICVKKDEVIMEGSTITITLTQEDTLKFKCGSIVEAQVRVITNGGESLASYVVSINVYECLDDEVL